MCCRAAVGDGNAVNYMAGTVLFARNIFLLAGAFRPNPGWPSRSRDVTRATPMCIGCLSRQASVNFPFTTRPGWEFSLPVVYLIWAGLIVALYPLCRWFPDQSGAAAMHGSATSEPGSRCRRGNTKVVVSEPAREQRGRILRSAYGRPRSI